MDKDGQSAKIQYIQTSLPADEVITDGSHQLTTSDLQPLDEVVTLGTGGELDPSTGVYYSSGSSSPRSKLPSAAPPKEETIIIEHSPRVQQSHQQDFLSSALTQAQIDLDPYQFIEEDPAKVVTSETAAPPHQGVPLVSLLFSSASSVTSTESAPVDAPADIPQSSQQYTQGQGRVIQVISSSAHGSSNSAQTVVAMATKPNRQQFIPLHETLKTSGLNIVKQHVRVSFACYDLSVISGIHC